MIYKTGDNSGLEFSIENYINKYFPTNKVVNIRKVLHTLTSPNAIAYRIKNNQILFIKKMQCFYTEAGNPSRPVSITNLKGVVQHFYNDLSIDTKYQNHFELYNLFVINRIIETTDLYIDGYLITMKKDI